MDDLAKLLRNEKEHDLDQKIDLSTRPRPKNVRAILDSGFEVQCEVKYDGHWQQDVRCRRYLVQAEIDWTKHYIATLLVGEGPVDVVLIIDLPGSVSDDVRRYLGEMKTVVEKEV